VTIEQTKKMVLGILQLAGCGGSHEIERNEELAEFCADVEMQDDGTIFVCDSQGDRFQITIQDWDSAKSP
jgi:hypothetical protein